MAGLTDVLPPRARRIAYATFAGVGLALGAVPVYCAATGDAVPKPIIGALAVVSFVGVPLFGATAAANVDVPPKPIEPKDPDGPIDP